LRPLDKPETQLAARLFSGAAIAVCLFGHLGAIGLVGPDEPRYAWIARAMAETGDWVTPRLYGQPWFEKPVLYYWAAAVGFRLHVPDEWAARLPSAFAALIAALAIGWLARKHYNRDAGSLSDVALLAPLLFATSVAAIGFARSASPDMLFSASITLAMASASEILRRGGALRSPANESSRAALGDLALLAFFGAFLGLGVLAKGPAAVALAGGGIGLWTLATQKWRAAFRLAHPVAIGAFCLVALPWYVLCAVRNPDFLRIFLFQHNVERYLTPMFQHRQPFWYFGPIVVLALVPWTTLLWPAAQEGMRTWRENSWRDSPGFLFACWAAFPVVFFSFSQSKLPGYVLPAIPPLALLCAVSATRALDAARFRTRLIFASIGLLWLPLGILAWRYASRAPFEVAGPLSKYATAMSLIAAVLIPLAAILISRYRNPSLVVALCALSVCVTIELVSLSVLPVVDGLFSARAHAVFVRNDQHPDRIFAYQLQRKWNYGLAFYFRRELPEWSPSDPEAALVLTTPAGLAQIRKLGRIQERLDEPYAEILYVPVRREPR